MAADEAVTGRHSCQQYKSALYRNFRDKAAFDKEHQNLESQRKAFNKQINKEELEMRELLQKLHMVRSCTVYKDTSDVISAGVASLCTLEVSGAQLGEEFAPVTRICTDPYPISFPSSSRRRRITVSGHEGYRSCFSSGRRKSVEYEDIISRASPRRSLPLIRSAQLSRSCSVQCRPSAGDPGTPWVGDPRAISSVRRSKVPVWKQKQRWTEIRLGHEPSAITSYCSLDSRAKSSKGSGVSRHLSLKEDRFSCSRSRITSLDRAVSVRDRLSRPRSLPDIRVEATQSPEPVQLAEIVTVPEIKQSALPFSVAHGEKEWKPCLKRKQSSKRPRQSENVSGVSV